MTYLQNLKPINRFAHWNALGSFLVGTMLLLVFIITQENNLVEMGMGYLMVAFVWNCLVLILVIIAAIGQKTSLVETFKTIGILLLNIPIAFSYFLIVLEF
ncbi:MAG: hypothetical protein ACSHWW_05015 [Nonlabens sp.]|uniref:hypothetical protein n=1 Tax=Nonlabens sp. TaxID=1888209 RepID=UPI003EF84823